MTALPKNTDKILVNREVDVCVALKQNELGDLLMPLVMNAGPTVVDSRLCVILKAGDWNQRDVGRSVMPEPIQCLRRSQMDRVEAGATHRWSESLLPPSWTGRLAQSNRPTPLDSLREEGRKPKKGQVAGLKTDRSAPRTVREEGLVAEEREPRRAPHEGSLTQASPVGTEQAAKEPRRNTETKGQVAPDRSE